MFSLSTLLGTPVNIFILYFYRPLNHLHVDRGFCRASDVQLMLREYEKIKAEKGYEVLDEVISNFENVNCFSLFYDIAASPGLFALLRIQ
jgi:hypothetical protein